MRTASHCADLEQGDASALEKLIGYRIRHKPYVGEFTDILAGYLQSLN